MSIRSTLAATALAAVGALVLAPAASAAPAIALSQPCYVEPRIGEETTVTVTGSGGVKTKPATAPYSKVVTYVFSGFAAGKPIFGHFLKGGHVVATHKYGLATGACGLLRAKSKLFPGNGPRNASYKVQFDDSKKYNPSVARKIVTKLPPSF